MPLVGGQRGKFKPKIPKEQAFDVDAANPIYECITPLRCVLIKDLAKDNFDVMKSMEQHTEIRQREEFYKVNQTNTVNLLLEHFGLKGNDCTFCSRLKKNGPQLMAMFPGDFTSAEEINAMIDVLDVNAFEIRGSDFSVRSVLPLTAMMNSVCSPNTQNCISGEEEGFK